ncbi:hypothetical protein GBA52_003482 [Prunus armeniaca]|nr:hypothetical protein GBA52_003482 [Prunus armeniaca]
MQHPFFDVRRENKTSSHKKNGITFEFSVCPQRNSSAIKQGSLGSLIGNVSRTNQTQSAGPI